MVEHAVSSPKLEYSHLCVGKSASCIRFVCYMLWYQLLASVVRLFSWTSEINSALIRKTESLCRPFENAVNHTANVCKHLADMLWTFATFLLQRALFQAAGSLSHKPYLFGGLHGLASSPLKVLEHIRYILHVICLSSVPATCAISKCGRYWVGVGKVSV